MFELENFKDNIACITPSGEQVSYGELQALTARIISNLKPYQLVFSMCSNTIGSVAGYISFVNNDDVRRSMLYTRPIYQGMFGHLRSLLHQKELKISFVRRIIYYGR